MKRQSSAPPDQTADYVSQRKRFVRRYGVLGWGVPFGLAMAVWQYWEQYGWSTTGLRSAATLVGTAWWMGAGLAGGYWFGVGMWRYKKRDL